MPDNVQVKVNDIITKVGIKSVGIGHKGRFIQCFSARLRLEVLGY